MEAEICWDLVRIVGYQYEDALRTRMKWNHEPLRKYQLPVNLAFLLARFGYCQV